jgi:hypothetical protein
MKTTKKVILSIAVPFALILALLASTSLSGVVAAGDDFDSAIVINGSSFEVADFANSSQVDSSVNIIVDGNYYDSLTDNDQELVLENLENELTNKKVIYATGSFETSQEIVSEIAGSDFDISVMDLKGSHYLGASVELISTGQTIVAMYFSETELKGSEIIKRILSIDAISKVYEGLKERVTNTQLSVYPFTTAQRSFTLVHSTSKCEMQSVYNFTRRAVGTSETLWDVENSTHLSPKSGYESSYAEIWLDMPLPNTGESQRFLDYGPDSTDGQSTFAIEGSVSGGGNTATISYSYSIADRVYTASYSSANRTCKWDVSYTSGTNSAKGSSTLRTAIRAANGKGDFVLLPQTIYTFSSGSGCSKTYEDIVGPALRYAYTDILASI